MSDERSLELAQPRRDLNSETALDRILADPGILEKFPMDKFKELVSLQRQLREDDARAAYALAFRDAQAEMEPVVKNAWNDHTKSWYARVADIQQAVNVIALRYGFSLSLSTKPSHIDKWMCFVLTIRHVDGHQEHHTFDAPPDGVGQKGGGNMNPVQGAKSAYTYAEGALLQKVWNLRVLEHGADDDGNAAGGTAVVAISPKQAQELRKMIDEAGADIHKFLAHYRIDAVEQMPKRTFPDAVSNLNAKMAQRTAEAQQELDTSGAVDAEAEEVEPEEEERIVCKGIQLGKDDAGKVVYGAIVPKPVRVGQKLMISKREGGWFPRRVAEIMEGPDDHGYAKVRTEKWVDAEAAGMPL